MEMEMERLTELKSRNGMEMEMELKGNRTGVWRSTGVGVLRAPPDAPVRWWEPEEQIEGALCHGARTVH